MVKVQHENKDSFTILTISGTPTVPELIEQIDTYFRNRTHPKTIWDFTNSQMAGLDVADYGKIIAAIKRHTGNTGNFHSALVFQSEIEQILGETFEAMAMASNVPIEYSIFGNLAAAIAWIKS